MKQSEEDANNWKAILCSWNGELILLKYPYYLSNLEEPEIKLPTSVGSSKKQESSRKTLISALLTTLKPLAVGITKNYGNS